MTEYREYRVVPKGKTTRGHWSRGERVGTIRDARRLLEYRCRHHPSINWKIEYRTVTVTTGPWRKHKDSP